jgi:hypothetical protein
MQWHRQATSDVPGLRGHHCRSERSIDHSPGRRFFRRGDARRRWLRQSDHLHSTHNGPTIAQDYTKDRDRHLPGCACTSHTRPQAARHSARADLHSADGDDDRIGLPHSTRARKAQPLQLRWYALIQILSRGEIASMRSRQRLRGTLESIQRRGLMRGIQFRLELLSKIKWPKYGAMVPILGQWRGQAGA